MAGACDTRQLVHATVNYLRLDARGPSACRVLVMCGRATDCLRHTCGSRAAAVYPLALSLQLTAGDQ